MKTKHIVLIPILIILTSFSYAQEKHEYLMIEYQAWSGVEAISIDGKEFTTEKVDHSKHKKSALNANPLLEKVKEFETQGWEVITLSLNHVGSAGVEAYYSYMRRKIE